MLCTSWQEVHSTRPLDSIVCDRSPERVCPAPIVTARAAGSRGDCGRRSARQSSRCRPDARPVRGSGGLWRPSLKCPHCLARPIGRWPRCSPPSHRGRRSTPWTTRPVRWVPDLPDLQRTVGRCRLRRHGPRPARGSLRGAACGRPGRPRLRLGVGRCRASDRSRPQVSHLPRGVESAR